MELFMGLAASGKSKMSVLLPISKSNLTRQPGVRGMIPSSKERSHGCWQNWRKILQRNTSVRRIPIITRERIWVNRKTILNGKYNEKDHFGYFFRVRSVYRGFGPG